MAEENEVVIAETRPAPEPGFYPDMSNDEYQATDAVSKSRLDTRRKSARHYWGRYIDPTRESEEKTEALIVGDACHAAVMEPDRLASMFVDVPQDAPTRPSSRQINAKNPSQASIDAIAWWKAFDAENVGRISLKKDHQEIVKKVRDAVHTHPKAKNLFQHPSAVVEGSYFVRCPRTGLLLKCRPDVQRLDRGMIVDFKTTLNASPEAFEGAITDYRYDVQDPWYRDIVNAHFERGDPADSPAIQSFVFVAAEKKPPFSVGIYWVNPEDVEDGRLEAAEDLDNIAAGYAAGLEKDHWPDHGFTPQQVGVRGWKRQQRRFQRIG